MKALLVVDMQPDTMVGRDTENLVETANRVIAGFDPALVFYIANLKPFEKRPEVAEFAEGLNVVSPHVFFKRRPDAFANPALLAELRATSVDEVDIIGIDGNWCVKSTALGAHRNGMKANVLTCAVVSKNKDAFRNKTIGKLADAGVTIMEE